MARGLLEEQFPALSGLPLSLLDSGWDNTLYRLGEDYLLRLPRRAMAADLVLNEQKWLPQLAPILPLPVPVPLHLGAPQGAYPWAWSILPWMEGRTADQSPPSVLSVLDLARFLSALHQPAPQEAPRNPYRGMPLCERDEGVDAALDRLELRHQYIDLWKQALSARKSSEGLWIHGDCHARNILVRDQQVTAVIDWGDMAQGDPATDLAVFWMLLDDKEERRKAWQAYGSDDEDLIARARGWALVFGLILYETGRKDHPAHEAMGIRILRNLN